MYDTLSQLGPDWSPKGVPNMYTQIVAITPNFGYEALTHAVATPPSSGYFDIDAAYNTDKIKTCGYKFAKRACDGGLTRPPVFSASSQNCTSQCQAVSNIPVAQAACLRNCIKNGGKTM